MSKSLTHTPGPWENLGSVVRTKPYREGDVLAGGFEIADCTRNPLNRHADAMLISAAPELLAACRAFVAWYPNHADGSIPALDAARAAIAKAEGR